MQRCRCTRNLGAPDGPCDACLKFSKTSKKTIHHIPCSRYKLTEISLFRKGGLAITQRWQGAAVKNIDSKDWDFEDPIVRQVEMQQNLCQTPLRFAVRRFIPSATDNITRRWMNRGQVKMVHLAPYALADVHEAKEIFREYLHTHAFDGFLWVVDTSMHDEIAKEVYSMTYKHLVSLRRHEGSESSPKSEESFMKNLFRLWFAMRHITGSSWLCGHECLGMTAVDDATYPLGDKISTPRIVVAQFNSIYITHHLLPLSSLVLRQMEDMFKNKAMNHWLTLFLSSFVLLYEISYISEDRYRYARQNNQKEEYSLPSFVQDLQEGANVILLHWHYLNCNFDPTTTNWEATPKTPRPSLHKEQIDFALRIWRAMKARTEEVKANLDAHEYRWSLYFVSQMFEKNWVARRTYAGQEVHV